MSKFSFDRNFWILELATGFFREFVDVWRATQFAKFRVGERGAVVSPGGVDVGLPMRVVDKTV